MPNPKKPGTGPGMFGVSGSVYVDQLPKIGERELLDIGGIVRLCKCANVAVYALQNPKNRRVAAIVKTCAKPANRWQFPAPPV